MTEVLSLKKANCKNCHKCIRACPVKSIRFAENQAKVIYDECVLCGNCVAICPQNAKRVRNDLTDVIGAIGEGKKVIAALAPAFISEYDVADVAAIERHLKQLGFFAVREVAEGAYIVKREYERMVREKQQDVIISSCCYTIVSLIQKYYPDLIGSVAPVLSPMMVTGRMIKDEFPGAYVVFIGPCISKKEEAYKTPGYIDCVLTFDELDQWFEKKEIKLERQSIAEKEGRVSRFFPKVGGIIECMDINPGADGFQYITVDGMENCIEAIEELRAGGLKHYFIEMSACEGSCIHGPAGKFYHKAPLVRQARVNAFAQPDPSIRKDFDIAANVALMRHLPNELVHEMEPPLAALTEILAKMGKTLPEHELNCGSCGYPTCRAKAKAVYNNKADITMCLPYLLENTESFSNNVFNMSPNGIIVLDSDLLIKRMNAAACHVLGVATSKEMVGKMIVELMDPTDFQAVLDSGNDLMDKRLYLEDKDTYIELSVVLDLEQKTLFGIIKDITAECRRLEKYRQRRAKTIDITDKVVEKQMRIVQEIASLLGETTAETKVALSQIKSTVLSEDD